MSWAKPKKPARRGHSDVVVEEIPPAVALARRAVGLRETPCKTAAPSVTPRNDRLDWVRASLQAGSSGTEPQTETSELEEQQAARGDPMT